MNTEINKIVQILLNKKLNISLLVDGKAGKYTLNAISSLNSKDIKGSWSTNRKVIGALQFIASEQNIPTGKIDGFYGPQTDYAFNQIKYKLQNGKPEGIWRGDEGRSLNQSTNKWPVQTQQALRNFYGEVGKNQVTIEIPYELKIAWNTKQKTKKITCHKLVADSIIRALTNVEQAYGIRDIAKLRLDMYGGCLNVRPIRGGNVYSTHAWGIALDFDPENNKLRWGYDKASFAKPEYTTWWDIWEAEGATSLGKKRNYDWMHVQFASI